MLLKEFEDLDWNEKCDLVEEWKLQSDDVVSYPGLKHRLSFVEWDVSRVFVSNYHLHLTRYGCGHFGYFAFNLLKKCFENYETFFRLCSSKGRVGKRSSISRIPNELFYKVIELFITK